MSQPQDGEPSLHVFRQEHRELRELIATIEQTLAQRTATLEQVGRHLAMLGDRLVRHFAFEEDGGYFSEALLQAPRLVAKANALLEQHPKMVRFTREMVAEVEGVEHPTEAWWQETDRRFREFRDVLLAHEQEENILIQEAFSRDIGSHD